MSPRLPNYLKSNRKRLALTQEEVAFLLGFRSLGKGAKVCRHERFISKPNFRTAMTYEAIYQKPIRELFAGMYERIEKEMAGRAKILGFRKDRGSSKRAARRRQTLTHLATNTTGPFSNSSQI